MKKMEMGKGGGRVKGRKRMRRERGWEEGNTVSMSSRKVCKPSLSGERTQK